MSSFTEEDGARKHVVRVVTLILDNEERWYTKLRSVAAESVAGFAPGDVNAREQFEDALAGRGAEGYRLDDYAHNAGGDVVDVLRDILNEITGGGGIAHTLMEDLLDLGDSRQADMFGHHYLPEDADDVPWNE